MTSANRLLALRNRDGGWGYGDGKASRLEPTCWALLAVSRDAGRPLDIETLLRWPRKDGWLVDVSGAPVNYAFNALTALTLRAAKGGETEAVRLATLLLGIHGEKLAQSPEIRQDNSLQAWPWIDSTFSWLEPTAWCVLLLKALRDRLPREAVVDRIRIGEQMITDRACAAGGWNYGGSNVYGQELFAYVRTTAIALLAMQDRRTAPAVRRAYDWLRKEALSEASTQAFAMARIALDVFGADLVDLDRRLTEMLGSDPAVSSVLGLATGTYAMAKSSHGPAAFVL